MELGFCRHFSRIAQDRRKVTRVVGPCRRISGKCRTERTAQLDTLLLLEVGKVIGGHAFAGRRLERDRPKRVDVGRSVGR